MKRIFLTVILLLIANTAHAIVNCTGTIRNVYKWDHFETLSIRLNLDGGEVSHYISLPTKSDESMALMAFASKTKVSFYWAAEDVTACVNGWSQNKKFYGYFVVGE